MTRVKRTAGLLVLAVSVLVLATAGAAFALGGSDTGGGGSSSGGGGLDSAGGFSYYIFTPHYDQMIKWVRGGGLVNPVAAKIAGTDSGPHSTPSKEFLPYIARGNSSDTITDHWNVYVARPVSWDISGKGAETAGVMAWASTGTGNGIKLKSSTNPGGRTSISGHDAADSVFYEYKWHYYWAADPKDSTTYLIGGTRGAPRPSKKDYSSASGTDDPHIHDNFGSRPVAFSTAAKWLNGDGTIDASGFDSGHGRIHWFQDPEGYIDVSGSNGDGGKPKMTFNMGALENQLNMPEGRYALYIYRIGNRDEVQNNGGKLADEEPVLRPRVRVKFVDASTGAEVPGGTAVLSVPSGGNDSSKIPVRFGRVSFTTPAFAAGVTAGEEESTHRSYLAYGGTGTQAYTGDMALNGGLFSLGWSATTATASETDPAKQVPANFGYYLDMNLPSGCTFAGSAGDVSVTNGRYADNTGSVLEGVTTVMTGMTPISDTPGTVSLRGGNVGSSVRAGGYWTGMTLSGGVYEFTVRVNRPNPTDAAVTLTTYFDANGNHRKDAGESGVSVAAGRPTVTVVGPTGSPDIAAYTMGPGLDTVLPAGDYVGTVRVPDPTLWRISDVAKSTGPAESTVYTAATPSPLACVTDASAPPLSESSWDAVGPAYYGDEGIFHITVAAGSRQTVDVGIAHYVAVTQPVLNVPLVTGPNAWLDSGKPASFDGKVLPFPSPVGPADGWKREPYYGVTAFPAFPDWVGLGKTAPIAYVSAGHDRQADGTVDLGSWSQVWTAPNADRDGGLPNGYTLPGGSLDTTWTDFSAAKAAAPVFTRNVPGQLVLPGWVSGDAFGVNYYAAVLWKVTVWTTTGYDSGGNPIVTTRSYYQWGEPAVKNVKVYSTSGLL